MADIVSAAVRSRMMAGIKGKNTNPEMLLRRGLHARGFRFRLHDKSLPGTPDIILPRHRAVLFAHGCFWHGHDCHLFKWPRTREEFWRAKIARNQELDAKAEATLAKTDWRYAVVWECALKGRTRLPIEDVLASCVEWIRSDLPRLEVRGI